MQTGGSRRTEAKEEQNEKYGSQRLGAIVSRVKKFLGISSVEGILVILTKTAFCSRAVHLVKPNAALQ